MCTVRFTNICSLRISLYSFNEMESCLTKYADRFEPSPPFLHCQKSQRRIRTHFAALEILFLAWGIWNIGGLNITMRLHFSFPWKSEEKQTLFSNILLPSEELNQTFLPTHFCPRKQPASLTAKLGIHIHSIFLAFFAHSTGSHFTGLALVYLFCYQVHQHYLFICSIQTDKEISPQKISGNSSTATFLLSQQVPFLAPSVSWKSVL